MQLVIRYYTDMLPLSCAEKNICEKMGAAAANAQQYMDSNDHVEWGLREHDPANNEIVSTGVRSGGIVIWDRERSTALKLLAPYQANEPGVTAALRELWQYEFDEATGEYVNQSGNGEVLETGNSLFPGFGLFDLGLNLPDGLWLLLVAGSGYKMSTAENTGGKVLWGTLGTVCTVNLANNSLKK